MVRKDFGCMDTAGLSMHAVLIW